MWWEGALPGVVFITKHHNSSLLMGKTLAKAKLRDILENTWLDFKNTMIM